MKLMLESRLPPDHPRKLGALDPTRRRCGRATLASVIVGRSVICRSRVIRTQYPKRSTREERQSPVPERRVYSRQVGQRTRAGVELTSKDLAGSDDLLNRVDRRVDEMNQLNGNLLGIFR